MKPLVTVALIVLTTFCHAECPIECFCGDRVTICTGNNLLVRFPKIYPGDGALGYMSSPLTNDVPIRLELHNFVVKHLSRKDFLQIISNLSEISISRNSLETFDNDTFSLDFTTSSSTQVSRDEEIYFLELRILNLSQNRLKYFVGGGKLCRLKVLDMSSNMLQQVYKLSEMKNLESVNLRDNRISFLEANIFKNLRKLRYLNLDANLLEFVHPSTFSNLPALARLILSSNPISNLVPGFYWDSRVQFVDVSNVGLTSIPPSLTKTVRDFRCARNHLRIVRQTDFESYPNLRLLVLDRNFIETVDEDAFGRLEFLSTLSLNENRLNRIPQKLPLCLRSLQLESNLIANLSSTDFKNLQRLEELNLHGNRISFLPPSVFSELTSLKSLTLRSNLIDVIYHDSFAGLSKLNTLDISQNPIKVIVTGAFGMLSGVSFLRLSRLTEPIELDVSCFQPFQNLRVFQLDQSPHLTRKIFEDEGFSYFPNLLELNLQECGLENVVLICSALAELNLRAVKMHGNPWDCQDLQGSPAVYELISSRVVTDEPTCGSPLHLKHTSLANLNFSTPDKAFPFLNVIITSQEKEASFRSPSSISPNFSHVTTDLPENDSDSVSTQSYFDFPSSVSRSIEDNERENINESDQRDSSSVNESGVVSKGAKGQISLTITSDKKPQNLMPFSRKITRRTRQKTGRPAQVKSLEGKAKTNDDKAVGDDSRLRESGRAEEEIQAKESHVQRSIDGFPPAYLEKERVAIRASSESHNVVVSNPKYGYFLKFNDNTKAQRRRNLPQDENNSSAGSSESTVIVKTLVISALTCLGSVLSLFFLCLAFFQYTQKRNTSLFSCHRPCSRDQGEDTQQQGMSYTRFGRKKSNRRDIFSSAYDRGGVINTNSNFTNRPHHDIDLDRVELSGITNSVYFENEDIYHIT